MSHKIRISLPGGVPLSNWLVRWKDGIELGTESDRKQAIKNRLEARVKRQLKKWDKEHHRKHSIKTKWVQLEAGSTKFLLTAKLNPSALQRPAKGGNGGGPGSISPAPPPPPK